ncbi:choice-of-anchor E domain-containing protein [Paracoccus sp. (in: a-proteobacteria)]|uniref:choice-of-anchor E domain-containing protein n=1 Tax=Paracoccus sp. TaxID=267 RepID=UPI003A89A6AE
MKKFVIGAVAGAITCLAQTASAATVTHTDNVAMEQTGWAYTLSVPQFDTALGTLNSVMVTLVGYVEGSARSENIGSKTVDVTLNLEAEITAATTVLGIIAQTLPVVATTHTLSAYDGTLDWLGTSGVNTGLENASETDVATLTGGDMAEFVGAGLVGMDIVASGFSFSRGSGNMVTQFETAAKADLTVVYDYTPASVIPLPASAPLLLGGLFLLGRARRRKAA